VRIRVTDPAREDAARLNEDHHLCIRRQRCSRKIAKIQQGLCAIPKRPRRKLAEHTVVHNDRPCVEHLVKTVKRTSKMVDPKG
jgi:hypothetical protein